MAIMMIMPRRNFSITRTAVTAFLIFAIISLSRVYLPGSPTNLLSIPSLGLPHPSLSEIGSNNQVFSNAPSSQKEETEAPVQDPTALENGDASIEQSQLASTTTTTSAASIPLSGLPPDCPSLAGASDVVVVMKTGASEVMDLIPQRLLTQLRCIPHFEIVSDMEQDMGAIHIHDAVASVSEPYKSTHEDFAFWRQLQDHHSRGQDMGILKAGRGWELDKWKNIPALHMVYQMHSDKGWFVFIDADTYLGWPNLLHLLSLHNSSDPWYIGSIWSYGSTAFAQGGTGYIISNAAARMFEDVYDDAHVAKWENDTSTACCGDVMLANAMNDAGVNITAAVPLVQSEPPHRLEWSDGMWCTSAVTWHHVRPYEEESLWGFEQERAKENGGVSFFHPSFNSLSLLPANRTSMPVDR